MNTTFKKSDFFLDNEATDDGDLGIDLYVDEPEEEPTAEDMDFINDGPIDYFQEKSKKRGKKRWFSFLFPIMF